MSQQVYHITGCFSSPSWTEKIWADNEEEAIAMFEERMLENVNNYDISIEDIKVADSSTDSDE